MIWIIISIIVVIILCIWYIRRPHYHRGIKIDEIERFIRGLISQCDNGSLLFIEHESSDRFIQFAIYETKENSTILHFGFPDAPWSREYFNSMIKEFKDANVDFKIQPTGEEPIRRFIDVDIETSQVDSLEKKGTELSKLAFKAMNLGYDEKYRVRYEADLSSKALHDAMENIKKGRKLRKEKRSGSHL